MSGREPVPMNCATAKRRFAPEFLYLLIAWRAGPMSSMDVVLLVIATILAVPFLVLAVEALASLLPLRHRPPAAAERVPCVILMPAHDEEVGIAATIANVREQLVPGDRILVVADNCTDETATIARAAGVEVAERSDPDRRGKGFALDFGLER